MSDTTEITIDVAGIMNESIVDGPGIRYAIFCQGCPHHCQGCHNPETHPFGTGTKVPLSKMLDDIDKDPLLKGVTFSGGEPFCQAEGFLALAREIKSRGKDIVIFTGYTYEELTCIPDEDDDKAARNGGGAMAMLAQNKKAIRELMSLVDVLIDGRFVLAERDLTLNLRGSRNQRVIDMNKTRASGQVTLLEE